MDNIINKYLNYKAGDSKQYHKELEVRFATRGKSISREQYDNVVRKLRSVGFYAANTNGEDLLRIMNQYDPSNKAVSNIRTEITGIEHIQYYCKHNRIPEHKGSVKFQKKFNLKENGKNFHPYTNTDFNFRVSFQIEDNIYNNSAIVNTLLEKWEQMPKSFRYMNRIEYRHAKLPFVCHLSIVKSSHKLRDGSYTYEKNIKNVDLFNQREHYEIEIEALNDLVALENYTTETLMSEMKKMIKYILCGLQNTNYPVAYGQLDNVMKEYLELVGNEKEIYRVNPRDFLGPSTITLQRVNIQNTNEEKEMTLVPNIRTNYSVTEKADGERRLLYISGTGEVYMIDTNMTIAYTGVKTTKKNIVHTLLDGELIIHDKYGGYLNLFACFDVYFINKQDRRALPLVHQQNALDNVSKDTKTDKEKGKAEIGRLQLAERVINVLRKDIVSQTSRIQFDISMKQFYYGKNIFTECKKILSKEDDGLFQYEVDGLIFTPLNESVPIHKGKFTWNKTMKWKPPEYNTIDFLVSHQNTSSESNESHNTTHLRYDDENIMCKYKTLHLRVGYDEKRHGYMNPVRMVLDDKAAAETHENKNTTEEIKLTGNQSYRPYLFYPSNPYDENAHICNIDVTRFNGYDGIYTERGEVIENNTIVEFKYDVNASDTKWAWKPIRVRYDKTRELRNNVRNFGNDYTVANNNWNTIHYPVTKEMISTGLNIPDIEGNDDVYYNRTQRKTFTQGMRDFHNLYVKKFLISALAHPGDKLFDVAVGKGGDFPKWISSELSFVFGIDKSKDNIENRLDGAYSRYINYVRSKKNIPDALFIHGDSGEVYSEDKSIENEQYKLLYNAILGSGSRDEKALGSYAFNKYGIAKDGFEITSCQFALHYFFESIYTLQNFIQNVVNVTQVGGYFVGTSYDGKTMFDYLKDVKKGDGKTLYDGVENDSQGTKIWEVTKQYDYTNMEDNVSSINYAIDIYQDSINKTFREYLVNYDYLDTIMERHGFRKLNSDELKNIGLNKSRGSFRELYNHMQTMVHSQISHGNYGKAESMTMQEKEISFLNTYFIYKKVRHETLPVKLTHGMDVKEDEIRLSEFITNLDKETVK